MLCHTLGPAVNALPAQRGSLVNLLQAAAVNKAVRKLTFQRDSQNFVSRCCRVDTFCPGCFGTRAKHLFASRCTDNRQVWLQEGDDKDIPNMH